MAIEVSWSDNLLGLMEHGSELSKIALKARFTQPKIMTCPRHLIFFGTCEKVNGSDWSASIRLVWSAKAPPLANWDPSGFCRRGNMKHSDQVVRCDVSAFHKSPTGVRVSF